MACDAGTGGCGAAIFVRLNSFLSMALQCYQRNWRVTTALAQNHWGIANQIELTFPVRTQFMSITPTRNSSPHGTPTWSIFLLFLRLGLRSFGGPVAHIAYFRQECVVRRRWLSERSYADLVALCQFLPGPASSQVGMALGLSQRGYRGALAAWAGFTLPAALIMVVLALSMAHGGGVLPVGVLHGLALVAVAVVAQAVWGMGRSLCPDAPRISIMAGATCAALLLPTAWGQVGVMALAGLIGLLGFKPALLPTHDPLPLKISRRAGVLWLALFLALLLGLPLLADGLGGQALAEVRAFFEAGALVFGGGHVALPLLQAATVSTGWIPNDVFMAGYGAVQAMPGPLFSFSAFLGASMQSGPSGWAGGLLCLVAIFAPSFLLVVGTLPFWEQLRRNARAQAALMGINAGVVGLLLAALYQPLWRSAVLVPSDFAMALVAFVALAFWKLPPWLVVVVAGFSGWGLGIAIG